MMVFLLSLPLLNGQVPNFNNFVLDKAMANNTPQEVVSGKNIQTIVNGLLY